MIALQFLQIFKLAMNQFCLKNENAHILLWIKDRKKSESLSMSKSHLQIWWIYIDVYHEDYGVFIGYAI